MKLILNKFSFGKLKTINTNSNYISMIQKTNFHSKSKLLPNCNQVNNKKYESKFSKRNFYSNFRVKFSELNDSESSSSTKSKSSKTLIEQSNDYSTLALSYYKLDKFTEAVKNHKIALDLNPKNVKSLLQMGFIHSKLKNNSEAIDYFKKFLELVPYDYIARNRLVDLLITQNKYDEALIHSQKELEFAPIQFRSECLNNMATIFKNLGKINEAINCYNKAIKIDPKNEANLTFYNSLALLHEEQGDLSEAINTYKKAIELFPLNSNVKLHLAGLLESVGRSEEVTNLIKSVINTETDIAILHEGFFNLGYRSFLRNNFSGAETYFLKAIEYNPNNTICRMILLEILLTNNNLNDIENQYKKIVELFPKITRFHLVKLCRQVSQTTKINLRLTTEYFLKLELEANPKNEEAIKILEELNQKIN